MQVAADDTRPDEVLEDHAAEQRHRNEVVQDHLPEVTRALLKEEMVGEVLQEVSHLEQRVIEKARDLLLVGQIDKAVCEVTIATQIPRQDLCIFEEPVAIR